MWLIWEPINLNYRGDRPQAVPQGTGKKKKHNKTQKLNREHLFSPPTDPQSSPVGGQPGFRSLLKAVSPRACFQMPGGPNVSQWRHRPARGSITPAPYREPSGSVHPQVSWGSSRGLRLTLLHTRDHSRSACPQQTPPR